LCSVCVSVCFECDVCFLWMGVCDVLCVCECEFIIMCVRVWLCVGPGECVLRACMRAFVCAGDCWVEMCHTPLQCTLLCERGRGWGVTHT